MIRQKVKRGKNAESPIVLRRTKRTSKKTKRFGRRVSSVNKDSLFEEMSLNAEFEQEAIENNNNDENVSEIFVEQHTFENSGQLLCDSGTNWSQNNYQKQILDKLEEISIRLDLLEKNQVEAIVERQISGNSDETSAAQHFNILEAHGLPARSKEDLDKLEFDLNKPDVKQSLVST